MDPFDVKPRPFSVAGKLGLLFGLLLALAATLAAVASSLGATPLQLWLVTVGVALPLGLWLISRFLRPGLKVLAALRDGVDGFRSRDFSLRLSVDPGDELGELVALYNDLGDVLSRERGELRQRELLLHTVLESSPEAVLLVNAAERVIFANRAARTLFFDGRRLEGHAFAEIVDGSPEPIGRALAAGRDALVSATVGDHKETFLVSCRAFELNTRRHLLFLVRHMTAELRRQEVAVWKKVIRVISHELRNSLAPIRSMVHSARLIRRSGDDAPGEPDPRVDEIFDHIDESAAGLHRFIEGYARFARLPEPRLETVDLRSFLEHLRQLEPFRLDGEVPAWTVRIDPAQIQQVLINLLKNAREAESPAEEIAVAVDELADGGLALHVLDRGCGMDEEQMVKALVPFYSSKQGGTGLGLALSREILEAHGGRLELAGRDGGGLAVTCRLPPAAP